MLSEAHLQGIYNIFIYMTSIHPQHFSLASITFCYDTYCVHRDAHVWAESLEMMRQLRSEYMVPSHTRPVIGAAEIDSVLGVYRDAVLFVHDQTVRLMNRG